MKQVNNDTTFNQEFTEIVESGETRKPYTSPELTHYGDISSLVQLVVVGAADGGGPPFQAQS